MSLFASMDPETSRNLQTARRLKSGLLPVEVSWKMIAGLALRVGLDRGYDVSRQFPGVNVPEDFFHVADPEDWEVVGASIDVSHIVAWLEREDRDNAIYLELLVRLLVRRVKYRAILMTQAFATSEQVGPRTLLEHGLLEPGALSTLVVWRKWMMDVDNRSGQETGYLYDAVVARALGGKAYGARNSPIYRAHAAGRRQVDCIVEPANYAYEVKIRITNAASRQGRLAEELSFPEDCSHSGYIPRLLVFDPTPCKTLDQVVQAFRASGGEAYLGQTAYDHIGETAGPARAEFLRRYVADPLRAYDDTIPDYGRGRALADLRLSAAPDRLTMEVSGFDPYVIERAIDPTTVLPEDDFENDE
jgi:hypothetical protein